jgi:hypothetical protein
MKTSVLNCSENKLIGAILLTAILLTSIRQVAQAQPAASVQRSAQDFARVLKGRFILSEAQCAGFEFLGANEIIWRNEITCMDPDTMLLHWVDGKSFLVKDKKSPTGKQDRPPRNWFYTVQSFDGNQLMLTELWTGWGPFKTEVQKYVRSKK